MNEKPLNERPRITNYGCAVVSYAAILGALAQSGMRWEMHPAQLFSLEMLYTMKDPVGFERLVKEEKDKLMCELIPATRYTMCGIPILVREDVPRGWIRLMFENKEIVRLEALAVPSIYMRHDDFNKLESRDAALAEALLRQEQQG
jgi:hypothetical protein